MIHLLEGNADMVICVDTSQERYKGRKKMKYEEVPEKMCVAEVKEAKYWLTNISY